jgi:16S rRNA (guanine527-N7)-methyltransferase
MDISIIEKYFELTSLQKSQMEKAADLYLEWNQQINVVSRKDIEHILERHFLHALAIAKFTKFTAGTKVLDIGTGGGFPAIPLAIMFPETDFYPTDSIAKKIKVVEEVSKGIGLTNVHPQALRAEKVKQKFDFIVSRAVTAFPKFMAFCNNKISKEHKNGLANGIIYLKGGDFEEEIKPYKKAEVYEISQYFEEEFFDTKKIIYLPY